jgi:hypothetical protein
MDEDAGTRHPAKNPTSRWFWHDRSDQSESIQIIDLLHDIRFLLLVIAFFTMIGG